MILVLVRAIAAALSVLRLPLWLLRRAFAAPKGGFVHLVLDGPLRERPVRAPWPFGPAKGTELPAVRKLAKAVAEDPRAAGLLVTVKTPGSAVDRKALLDALQPVKDAKKPIVAHLPQGGGTPALHAAAAADAILVSKGASLGPLGASTTTVHARDFLDLVGVVPEVVACGAYKSAGDALTRNELSDANRAQLDRMLDVSSAEVVGKIAGARRVDEARVRAWLDEGLVGADRAKELGVVDEVVHDDEVPTVLARVAGRPEGEARLVGASTYLRRRTAPLFRSFLPAPFIAVVPVEGPIVESGRGGRTASAEVLVPLLRSLGETPWVRGVVLAIDSPGGGVLASEKIHRAVSLVAKQKPVVARMGNVAASGGYYVAAAAHEIVASPLTITGSIGVIAARMSAGPLLARLGIHVESLRRGARADLFSPDHALTPEDRAALEREIGASYERFLEIVAEGRGRPKDDIRPLAEGRVWMGTDALANGLVDKLGSMEDALEAVRARAGGRRFEARWLQTGDRPPLRELAARTLGRAGDVASDLAAWVRPFGEERVLALYLA